jgi:hypothetical protein
MGRSPLVPIVEGALPNPRNENYVVGALTSASLFPSVRIPFDTSYRLLPRLTMFGGGVFRFASRDAGIARLVQSMSAARYRQPSAVGI